MGKSDIFPQIPSQEQLDAEWKREKKGGPKMLAFVFVLVLVFWTFVLVSCAVAGGLEESALAPDPCIPADTDSMTDEMLRGWQAMLAMKADECGPPPVRAFFDRHTGEQLSEDEILRRMFNGSTIDPTPVPVPQSIFLLFIGMLSLSGVRLWKKLRTC